MPITAATPRPISYDSRRFRALALAVCFAAPCHASADDAADIRTIMDRMTAAVLAGDKASYVACVDASDPVFHVEQVNWSADFDRHKVGEFSVSWSGDGPKITGDEAEGELTFDWKMAADGQRARTVTYPGTFVRRGGAWRFAGEKWKVIEAPGLRICFAQGLDEVAGRVAELLPAVREHVHKGFDLTIDRVQVVKLYTSMKHLQHSIYLSYTDGLSGWNEPGESVKILPGRRATPQQLRPLLAHEYGHVCTFELGPKANEMPWWILEGVAELSAEEYQGKGYRRMVESWAANDTLADWSRLADFHNCTPEDQVYVYQQGHHMLGYISDRFGRGPRNAWMKRMAIGATLDEATKEALGLDFAALDQQWRQSLRNEARGSEKKEAPAIPSGN